MQGSAAGQAGKADGDSAAAMAGGVPWAEKRFPNCSTVLSKATRLSGLLAEVWETLADESAVQADRPRVLLFPECKAVAEARGLQNLYEHLEVCQDACEHFGTMVSIVPHPRGGKSGSPVPALVVQAVAGAGGGDDFGYDPDWDGDWDIDRSLLDDEDEDGGADGAPAVDIAALSVVPPSDEEVTELTKAWVQAVITDMGVCPFSVDASRAGLPVGQVRYPVSREATAEAIYREYWREVELLVSEANEKALSTTLLITPEFSLSNAEAFEVIGQTLTQPLEALHLEDDIQLVFFHPQYAFRDGRDRIGSGDAANFARRSPFPMINILRTNQVRLAQKSIPTGLVYKQNEEVLEDVGAADLQKMLERRDWSGLEGKKEEEEEEEEEEKEAGEGLLGDSRSGARGSLAAAAGAMPTTFEKGFSSGGAFDGSSTEDDQNDDEDDGGDDFEPAPPATTAAAAATPSASEVAAAVASDGSGKEEAPETPAQASAAVRAAATSAGIEDEDLKGVASALVKRLGTGRPLKPGTFDEFSEAVDRLLKSTEAP
eukprot:g4384.t1